VAGKRNGQSKKAQKARRAGRRKPGRGVMTGMRSGFKEVASTVPGLEARNRRASRRQTMLSIVAVVVVVLIGAVVLYSR
jgi:hypothetical protein